MKKYLLIAIAVFGLFSCKDDPIVPPPPGEEGELITTVLLNLADSADSIVKVFNFKDLDGEGGNAPQIDSIILDAQRTYFAELILLDESKTPADSISNEIIEEANDHMFFYHVTGANASINYADEDTNNPPLPLGLKTKWRAGAVSTGSLKLVLKHQPGIKNGTETPGETDIEVDFPLMIK